MIYWNLTDNSHTFLFIDVRAPLIYRSLVYALYVMDASRLSILALFQNQVNYYLWNFSDWLRVNLSLLREQYPI